MKNKLIKGKFISGLWLSNNENERQNKAPKTFQKYYIQHIQNSGGL